MNERTHLDLFSGIGGFALAAQWTGWKTIAFSEIEPYACKVLKRHWPDVPNLGDIRSVRNVRADLITGGFPCQPFSVAGKRAGAADNRHLWPEMCRVIDETRPTWVLGENVPGIIGMELDRVLSDLENLGYACWPVVVPACAVDARHRRDRVWIVGWNSDAMRCSRNSREKRALQNENTNANGIRKALADADKPGQQGRNGEELRERGTERIARQSGASVSDTEINSKRTGLCKEEPERQWGRRPGNACRWLPEPELGRVAHGVPNRAHRLKGLGNAIVPQVAAEILKAMIASEEQTL